MSSRWNACIGLTRPLIISAALFSAGCSNGETANYKFKPQAQFLQGKLEAEALEKYTYDDIFVGSVIQQLMEGQGYVESNRYSLILNFFTAQPNKSVVLNSVSITSGSETKHFAIGDQLTLDTIFKGYNTTDVYVPVRNLKKNFLDNENDYVEVEAKFESSGVAYNAFMILDREAFLIPIK